jgi:hypothetical protein
MGKLFKKGHVPPWTAPIGTEREAKGGRVRKIAGRPRWNQWVFVHILNWIDAHGPIPSGMRLICLGNRQDPSVDNYMLAPVAAVSGVNRRWPGGLASAPPELRRTIVAAAILECRMGPGGDLSPAGLPKTRQAALAMGVTYYFTGKPCAQGHRARRYARGSACCQCMAEYRARPDIQERSNQAQSARRLSKTGGKPRQKWPDGQARQKYPERTS